MREKSEISEPGESTEDEAKILADQDETSEATDVQEHNNSEEIGLDSEAFSRGEVDVAEQVQRTTKAMDHISGRGEKKATPL
jgi:hypothetical protein